MGNRYYELYQKYLTELEDIMKKYQDTCESDKKYKWTKNLNGAKKLKGAFATNLFKQEAEKYLHDNHIPFKISIMNSYIAGSKYEYDLLIVKEDAKPFMDLVYLPEDVIAIIESKVNGLYNIESETKNIAKAVNCAQEINPDIRFGYITIGENVPVNVQKKDGTFTVNHWELTKKSLNEKIKNLNINFAVTLNHGDRMFDEGLDNEFFDFMGWLVRNYD